MTTYFSYTPAAILIAALLLVPTNVSAEVGPLMDFESYTLGTIDLQDGWKSTGPYDHEVDVTSAPSFGTKALRISNAITSGSFGDQTFSKSLVNEAGEASAEGGGLSGGVRQPYFEAEWQFASAVPGAEQPGLSVVASPDRGDGARMSWVQMADTSNGLAVNFYDFQEGEFVQTSVATGLARNVPHTIKITMEFVAGPANDIVKVYVDGTLRHTGTSWEDYFREVEGNPTRTVDSILFRTAGPAAPATSGAGFFIDGLSLASGPSKNGCKKGGWSLLDLFKNQGDCISSLL
ncbi:MAG TPA: hypothetical protein VFY28_00890 [Candidatus Paceibacterota bacterium]|nr:hypothetical protein [Candidatus Paceibacterota bacterium]